MPLNESKGNMYAFVTHTWNTVKGRCPHDCSYCYMKRWGEQGPLRFDKKELKTDLKTGNFIFVGSSCDMWAEKIPIRWINETLNYCIRQERGNKFLFQSKNPERFNNWAFPEYTTVGSTIETNRIYPQMGGAPNPQKRANALNYIDFGLSVMVTIEPVMDFDLRELLELIDLCRPNWVNIGADSGGHKLSEPPAEKVLELIAELSKFTEVKIKKNLKRILGRVWGQLPKKS